jgi:hypothetical protein
VSAPPKAKHESPPAAHTRPAAFFSLDGRADLLEVIVHALNESQATGVGRLLDYREGSAEPRR